MLLGGVPRVTSTRLDKVRAKIVFFATMPANIGRDRAVFQGRLKDLNGRNSLNPSGSLPVCRNYNTSDPGQIEFLRGLIKQGGWFPGAVK